MTSLSFFLFDLLGRKSGKLIYMRYYFPIWLSYMILVSCSGKQKNMDCSRFKTGKFKYHSSYTGRNFLFERTDSTQIEMDEESGAVLELKIDWINSCEYTLTFSRAIKNGDGSFDLHRKFVPVKTKILKAGEDYYIFRATSDGISGDMVDTIKIAMN